MNQNEPTILDYLKSKLTFWRKSSLKLPGIEAEVEAKEAGMPIEGEIPALTDNFLETSPETIQEKKPFHLLVQIPWLSFLALILALIAQRSLEPGTGDRVWKTGAVLYILAAGLLAWAIWRGEWSVSPLQEDERMDFRFSVNRWVLMVGALLAVIAYINFKEDLFTPVDTTLWVLAIAVLMLAFWQPRPGQNSWRQRIRRFYTTSSWNLKITRWTLALIAIALIIIFFRFYRIGQIPSDMVSDHAEKLLDVGDVLSGKTSTFFPRNTGREAFQFYWTAAIILLLKTGISFISLKIGTVLAGVITLPFIYLLGKDLANRRVGLFALILAGVAYWPNAISRFGLRFPLYPLFAAPTLYYLLRGLRRRSRTDFVLSGLALGIGLHGYTPVRILPFVVVAAVVIYLLHRQSRGARKEAIFGLLIITVISLVVFIPLMHYAVDNPDMFSFRTLTRIGTLERPLPGPAWQIFLKNLWNASTMFFWSDGEVWVFSITLRPALDVVSAALLFLGTIGLLVRYIRQRHWVDLFLVLSVPLLMLPSILSLAFPNENPSLNRTGGAIIPVFIIIGFALDGFVSALKSRLPGWWGRALAVLVAFILIYTACVQNYDLIFNQYATEFTNSAWNTAEMGQTMRDFIDATGTNPGNAWVVGFPYWVDTRLVGINAGYPTRDTAIWPDHFADTVAMSGAKLFLINPQDKASVDALFKLYPQGSLHTFKSKVLTKDFWEFMVFPQGVTGP